MTDDTNPTDTPPTTDAGDTKEHRARSSLPKFFDGKVGVLAAIGASFIGLMAYVFGRRESGREYERERSHREELDLLKEMRQLERYEEEHRLRIRLHDETINAAIDQQRTFELQAKLHRAELDAAAAQKRYWDRRAAHPLQDRKVHEQLRLAQELLLEEEKRWRETGAPDQFIEAQRIIASVIEELA